MLIPWSKKIKRRNKTNIVDKNKFMKEKKMKLIFSKIKKMKATDDDDDDDEEKDWIEISILLLLSKLIFK